MYPWKKLLVHAVHEVLMEVDDDRVAIVGNPQGIFLPTAQTSPYPLIKYYYFLLILNKLYIINFYY
jgi:hypothetical protein